MSAIRELRQRLQEYRGQTPIRRERPDELESRSVSLRSSFAQIDGRLESPLPLPKLPPVPEFPTEVLPDAFQDWVEDAAERARFRADFGAVVSMSALGSVVGRKLGIRLKAEDNWTEYANVWACLIGPPSALKSPAMREFMRPLKALQDAADQRHQQAHAEFEAERDVQRLRKDARRKAASRALEKDAGALIDLGTDDLDEPVARTYWTSNTTAQALGVLLSRNSSLLIERDELSSLLSALEDERQADTRGLLLSGWSGSESYRFDTIGRGTTALGKFALSVVGGIQPGPLARYVRGAFTGQRADGLVQRFQLLTWPEPEAFRYVDRLPNMSARAAADRVFQFADGFDPERMGAHDDFGPPFVRLSPGAQEAFVEWYSRFMHSRHQAEADNSEVAALSAHLGKYPGLVGKLALLLHIADDQHSSKISERTLLKALAWLEYLEPHARRVYHAVSHPETNAAELLLARLKKGELPTEFKSWQITRKGWHGLTDGEAVKRACRLLFEHRWLDEIDAGGYSGGRPADPTYAVSALVGLS